jgi:hypothetical protein
MDSGMTGKYEVSVALLGAQADADLKAITGVTSTVLTGAGATLGRSFDAAIASAVPPPPPPPPPGKVAIGTSPGPLGTQAAVTALPGCQVFRSFQGGLPTTIAKDPELSYLIAHKIVPWYSFGQMPSQAQFTACVQDWVGSGSEFWWTYKHEVDAPKETAPLFVQQFDQLQAWAEAVPGYASSKVRDQPIYMSYMLLPNHPHGDPNSWIPTRPTRLGFDSYTHQTMTRARDFAQARGKDWVIPEMGAGGPGGEGGKGDTPALAWVQALPAIWAAYPPKGACWYGSSQGTNARSDTLAKLPKTAAFLATL